MFFRPTFSTQFSPTGAEWGNAACLFCSVTITLEHDTMSCVHNVVAHALHFLAYASFMRALAPRVHQFPRVKIIIANGFLSLHLHNPAFAFSPRPILRFRICFSAQPFQHNFRPQGLNGETLFCFVTITLVHDTMSFVHNVVAHALPFLAYASSHARSSPARASFSPGQDNYCQRFFVTRLHFPRANLAI